MDEIEHAIATGGNQAIELAALLGQHVPAVVQRQPALGQELEGIVSSLKEVGEGLLGVATAWHGEA